jgi:gliding motility-associated-like protein
LKNLVFILLLFLIPIVRSQNLITNPSFEDIDSCYGASATIGFDVFEWSGCTGWSIPNVSSSDLWCENPVVGNINPPQIAGDYQTSHNGNNFTAILVGDVIDNSYREYLQNELISSLEPLSIYKFSCWISVTGLPCTLSDFSISFSKNKLYLNKYNLYGHEVYADNLENNYINDSLGWQKIEMEFIASGEEKFLQFGCFNYGAQLNEINCESNISGQFEVNYFFLDDFELVKLGEFQLPNVITLNNDGVNDLLDFNKLKGDWQCTIMNRWGNFIHKITPENPVWNGLSFGQPCTEGVYFLIFEAGNQKFVRQLTILR